MPAQEKCRIVLEDAAILAGKNRTEIDLENRVIRKTWTLMGFARSSTYELDRRVTVQVRDNSSIFEGYTMTSFGVYLTNGSSKIRISSTDDLNEARLIQGRLTELLKESAQNCPAGSKVMVSEAR